MSVSNFLGIAASNVSAINGIVASNISLLKGIAWSTAAAGNPQLQFFRNFPAHIVGSALVSLNTLSFQAVNIPLSLSFNYPVIIVRAGANNATRSGSATANLGLYSLNGSTLSLANSASSSITWGGAVTFTSWLSMATSATQNISPGAWYLALVFSSATNNAGASLFAPYANSSRNPENAIPGGFLMGRMTASTGALPASIATSDLDITGSDAMRQQYIIITA